MPEQVAIRLHPLLLRAAAQALFAIFREGRYADKVIEYTLRHNPKAGSRDRAFIAETTYEVVRYYRLYAEILGYAPQTEADFWKMCAIHFVKARDMDLPAWVEFKGLNIKQIREKIAVLAQMRAIRESIPDWLDQLGAAELGERWEATLHWLNRPAQVVLRANRLKTTRADLQKALQKDGIETQAEGPDDALVLERRQNVFQTKAFKDGLFEVQDYSSQLVAPLLAPEPGMRVVDACAGGGGKTLHLAALMQGKGQLIALDTLAWKLDELRQRARRAGASNIETRVIDSRKVVKRLYNSADRLLLDVPCSGLGVLRRNPDSKWKLQPETIDQLRATQQDILQSYSPIVKAGGRMVYATCSILPSENEQQVQYFLDSEPGKAFKLIGEKKILPQDNGYDGFYMALLTKGE
ncbi:MAG: RNA methyltransferase [Thermoanaerobaculia bacterium]|nr:RNA methyltransferase [Thermoanaerobaculia bacterium]